jgi:GNAT superfamily N-acetyltransferase
VGRVRVTGLSAGDVARLPAGCAGCLTWELGLAGPDPQVVPLPRGAPREDAPADPVARKRAWVAERLAAGEPTGAIAQREGAVVGWASWAPSTAYARRLAPVPAASPDALLLATLWVAPTDRGAGIGGQLVRAALRDAIAAGAGGLEAYGDRRWRERACVLPLTWLVRLGFVVHREHPRTPLLRIDVRRVLHLPDGLEAALESLLARLPHPVPSAGAGTAGHGASGATVGSPPPVTARPPTLLGRSP